MLKRFQLCEKFSRQKRDADKPICALRAIFQEEDSADKAEKRGPWAAKIFAEHNLREEPANSCGDDLKREHFSICRQLCLANRGIDFNNLIASDQNEVRSAEKLKKFLKA